MQRSAQRSTVAMVLAALGLGVSGAAMAAGDPSNFVLPSGFVEYGDAQSYALQVACTIVGTTSTNCPYYVDSQPGQIKDLAVIGTGSSGTGVTTNVTGIDNAYATPSGTGAPNFFTTRVGGAAYNNTGISNNLDTTWDASVGALNTFLGQTPNSSGLVFFFNNNQVNSGPATNQNLAAWAKIWLTDSTGALVNNSVFYFTNQFANGNAGALAGNGIYAPDPGNGCFSTGDNPNLPAPGTCNPNVAQFKGPQNTSQTPGTVGMPGKLDGNHTDYVLSGGQICLNASNVAVACNDPTAVTTVNNNLGANQAAYAIVFPELNDMILALAGNAQANNYTLHLDVELGCDPVLYPNTGTDDGGNPDCVAKSLNNGFEQIFIGALAPGQLPEPGTIALVGLALTALGGLSRRRNQPKA